MTSATPELSAPLLLLYGTEDSIAPWNPSFAERIAPARCRVRLLARGRHNLLLDDARPEVIAAVTELFLGYGTVTVACEPGRRRADGQA